ncbi:hypothetical protein [Amycolatopsis cihanbeyliensis]|uniref:Protein phosphatase 2C-like protein n=1 Tax=Amycolatopsis cihanbeyliensis TaxID=1128664 RepID=A0A542DKZ4_AMYCI|nr:hypothetical protein [Amycolatopsis cihanbeyliensis]TQJ03694.1 hypothetical protein FB471_3461 [Amycolatopsis cihanbeyliensis]
MRVSAAQLPAAADSDDRVFTTENAVIMLDGATAFLPVPVAAGTYADRLGRHLRDALNAAPDGDLREVLAGAIERTAHALEISPGASPSSTVTIARELEHTVDILVLGDNLVMLPDETLTDDRMDRLDLAPRRKYRERLAAGSGYDDEHLALLGELQIRQAECRNQPGGYWIAEADPASAEHALVTTRTPGSTPWAVLATDGAYTTMDYLGLDDWPTMPTADANDLGALLHHCEAWEAHADPDAQELPRAKRHDDKSLAVVAFG